MKNKKSMGRAALLCFALLLIFSGIRKVSFEELHSDSQKQSQENFDIYLTNLFRQEVTGSTINLHYTLRNPQNYGIENYTVTYGDLTEESHESSVAALENIQAALQEFDVKELDTDQQLTYDILKAETETELSAEELYFYQEPLRPSTGIQAELPVLMAEYDFYGERDVQDYLALLNQTAGYFRQILLFEMEKANRGLFMSEFAAEDIISQCRNFIAKPEQNYLLDTFDDKLEAMGSTTAHKDSTGDGDTAGDNGIAGDSDAARETDISQKQRESYREQNRQAVAEVVIPAYEMMIQGLEKLKKSGKNQQGLCHLPEGKRYYEYLVKSYTGSDRSVEEMQQAAASQRAEDITAAAQMISENPDLLAQSASYTFSQQEPMDILQELQEKMKEDFPAAPDTGFTVKYVHPSLEEFMAPAFYLAVPMDDISQNSIYINRSSNYQNLKLYTTLAHEGFPGHLYQNVMERSQEFPPIRSLLGTSGYSEGWATYVEMISYGYADMEPQLATLLQLDQSALLSLYASADMGIHGEGWSLAEMKKFFGEYQITDEGALTEIYHLIVEEPAHYLKYYIGYLEFLGLREEAERMFGESYHDYGFHEALMKMGPAQFSILKKYLPRYYSRAE